MKENWGLVQCYLDHNCLLQQTESLRAGGCGLHSLVKENKMGLGDSLLVSLTPLTKLIVGVQ